MWGIDEPYRETNRFELYRHGERGPLNRYIIPPADVIDKRRRAKGRPLLGNRSYELIRHGFTVCDALVTACAVAVAVPILLVAIDAWGIAFDSCADRLGW